MINLQGRRRRLLPLRKGHNARLDTMAPQRGRRAGRATTTRGAAVDLDMHPSGIVPAIQNIVATFSLGCKLDLETIATHTRNTEYNPRRIQAVIMRIRGPKTTALVFSSGKIVCTGAKTEEDARLAASKYARIIKKVGYPQAQFTDFKIHNMVGSCDVKFPIRLEGLAVACGVRANYRPELFPGVMYRMADPKMVLRVFLSGKVVLTGAKTREEIYTAFESIHPLLLQFKEGQQQ